MTFMIKSDLLADAQAEAALLWGVVQAPDRFDDIAILDKEDFTEKVLGSLYADMVEATEWGRALSNQTMLELMGRYEVNHEPLVRYLEKMTIGQRLPGFEETARHIRELSMLRKARKAATLLFEDVEGREDTLARILDRHTTNLAKLVGYTAASQEAYRYEDHTDRMIEIAQGLSESTAPQPFGIEALDAALTGILPGDVIVAAAPSGMGKSAFGGEVALNFALRGLGVFYVSAEMTGAALTARNTASLIKRNHNRSIAYSDVLKRKLDGTDLEMLVREAMIHRNRLPIQTIGPRSDIKVAEITRRAHAMQVEMETVGSRLGLIVIDHIGLLAGENPRQSIYERTTEISGRLAGLARSMNVPILILAQVRKGVEKSGSGRASADDIRDTNAIRQDANVILTLHRPRVQIERSIMEDYIDGELRRSGIDLSFEAMSKKQGVGYSKIAEGLEGDKLKDFEDCLDSWVALKDAFEITVEKNRDGPGGFVSASINIECNRIY